jgi:uncharacterized protein YaaQ
MKLILTILSDNDNDPVSHALVASNFRVTRIASTGGFFRRGSTTLLIGVADDQVDEAIAVIRKSLPPAAEAGTSAGTSRQGATLFVLNVENFTQI